MNPPVSQLRTVIFIVALICGLLLMQLLSGSSGFITLGIILAILLLVLTFVNTEIGLLLLIFSMLLSPEIAVGEIPGRNIVIRLDDILLMIITFGWLTRTAIKKGTAILIKTPLNKMIGIFIILILVSTLRGIVLGYVVPLEGFFYIIRYIEYFLLFILVANQIHSRKQIKLFLTAFLIVCAVVSVYGMLQIPSGVRVSAPFEIEGGEPNTFGGYLLIIFCITLGILLQNVSPGLRRVLVALLIIIIIPFFYTLSRASYMAIFFSFLVFVILSKKKLLLVSALIGLILAGIILRPEAIFSRVKYTFQERQVNLAKIGNVYLDPSSTVRVFGWNYSFQAWKKNPILGHGITGWRFIDGQYILFLPELGILGLLAFLWLLWSIFKHSLSVYKEMNDELYKGLTLGFIAAFIGLIFHAVTANTFMIVRIMEPFWFFAGIVIMLPTIQEEEVGLEM